MIFPPAYLEAFSSLLLRLSSRWRSCDPAIVTVEEWKRLFPDCTITLGNPLEARADPATALSIPIDGLSTAVMLRRATPFSPEERFLGRHLQPHVSAVFQARRSAPPHRPPSADQSSRLRDLGLTAREREVLRGLTTGRRNAEIARTLGISSRTVGKHVEHVLRKLGVESRLAAARLAAERLR